MFLCQIDSCRRAIDAAADATERPRCETHCVTDIWRLVEIERTTLADFLETLSPSEWHVQSLCAAWTVQCTAAHVAWGNTVPIHQTALAIVRAGFRANRANAQLGQKYGCNEPPAIIARLRDTASSRRLTPGTKPIDALADILLHDIDIREPLGKPRTMPAEAFGLATTHVAGLGFPISLAYGSKPKAIARGLHLVADDADWSIGKGPAVHGSASALLRALTGRPVRPEELTGPGAATIYDRLPLR